MSNFPTIDEVHDILDEIAEELPEDFFTELNKGIVLLPQAKIHRESRDRDKLYIMGEYARDITGRHIAIYYGSFEKLYEGLSIEAIKEKLKDTLLHEFTHHFESLAGEKGLEIEDARDMDRYRRGTR